MNALEGIRVLDLSRGVAGANATKLLADFGAEVTKLEPPEGDPVRLEPPFAGDQRDPERSLLFLHLNTNKRSVVLDLEQEPARELALQLAAASDVVVEDSDPGTMTSFGLGYDDVASEAPAIVYASITPWGQDGPFVDEGLRASEITLQSMGGPVLQTGDAEREPLKLGGQLAHIQAGAVAAFAVTSTIFRVEGGGEGDHLDISVYQTQAGSRDRRTAALTAYSYTGYPSRRTNTGGLAIAAGVRPAADGYINMVAFGEGRVERFLEMIGREDLVGDERLDAPVGVLDAELVADVEASYLVWLLQRGKRDVVATAQEHGLLAGVINTPEDLISDPHYRQRGTWEEIEHPVAGSFEYPGRPFMMSDTPRAYAERAPLLGEHTREVLAAHGVEESRIDELAASGALGEVNRG